jgi:hypothetical protein
MRVTDPSAYTVLNVCRKGTPLTISAVCCMKVQEGLKAELEDAWVSVFTSCMTTLTWDWLGLRKTTQDVKPLQPVPRPRLQACESEMDTPYVNLHIWIPGVLLCRTFLLLLQNNKLWNKHLTVYWPRFGMHRIILVSSNLVYKILSCNVLRFCVCNMAGRWS